MGFDFNEDLDLPWSEGTAQMAITFNMLNNMSKVDHYLHELHKFQDLAPRTNNKGLVASPKDGLTTGFGWCYFNRLYVGATAWFIMASLGYNPFWHESEPVEEIPYSVRVQGKIEGAINGDYVLQVLWFHMNLCRMSHIVGRQPSNLPSKCSQRA